MKNSETQKHIENCEISRLITWRRGVWVGKDIEIVRTNKAQILFKRDSDSPENIWSEFCLINYSDSGFEEDIRGIVYTDSQERTFRTHVKDLWTQQKEEPYIFDSELSKHAIRKTFKIVSYGENEIVLQVSSGEKELVSATGKIQCYDQSGSLVCILTKIEEFSVKEKGTTLKKLSESTITDCLRNWRLGTYLIKDDEFCNGLIINTNHHAYIFLVNGKDSCYCRTGRYETCEKGMVFAQNIRLWANPQGFVSFMLEDNEKVAADKLVIDELLFNPDTCVFTSEKWTAHIVLARKE